VCPAVDLLCDVVQSTMRMRPSLRVCQRSTARPPRAVARCRSLRHREREEKFKEAQDRWRTGVLVDDRAKKNRDMAPTGPRVPSARAANHLPRRVQTASGVAGFGLVRPF
jgi:hypothetical protein